MVREKKKYVMGIIWSYMEFVCACYWSEASETRLYRGELGSYSTVVPLQGFCLTATRVVSIF